MIQSTPMPDLLSGLAETAFIPLAARALAGERFPSLGFRDPTAEAICRALELDLGFYAGGDAHMLDAIARTWMLDRIVGVFTSRHPGSQIVDLGTGLSTRFERIDNGMMTWVEVDEPEVISLRRTLFPVNNRRRMVAVEVGSPSWAEALDLPAAPTMVIAEGILAYFEPETVRSVLSEAAAAVPGRPCEFAFDYVHPLLTGRPGVHPALKRMNARPGASAIAYRWGARRKASLVPRTGWKLLRTTPVDGRTGFLNTLRNRLVRRLIGGPLHAVAHAAHIAEPSQMPPPAPADGAAVGEESPGGRAAARQRR